MVFVYPYDLIVSSLEALNQHIEISSLGTAYQNMSYDGTIANFYFNTELDSTDITTLESLLTDFTDPVIDLHSIIPIFTSQIDVSSIDYKVVTAWKYNPITDDKIDQVTFESNIIANPNDNVNHCSFGYQVRLMNITNNTEITNVTLNNTKLLSHELTMSTLPNFSTIDFEIQCKKFQMGSKVNIGRINLYIH